MNNCRLVLEMRNNEVAMQAEHMDMAELAIMCGILEQLVGMAAFHRGISVDDIKDNMLDIHLSAMDALTEQVIRERGDTS